MTMSTMITMITPLIQLSVILATATITIMTTQAILAMADIHLTLTPTVDLGGALSTPTLLTTTQMSTEEISIQEAPTPADEL